MARLHDISLRWKLVIPVAIVATALVSLVVIALQVTGSISTKTHEISTIHLPTLDALVEADRDLYQAMADDSNRTVSSQLGEINQVATAMHEMTATIHDVAANAASAAHGAGEADAEARHGQRVVSETIKVIGELAAEVENSANVIQQLEAESANIGAVLDVIRDIAEQTNLLALNAAIEAARAGEQGRGFAVVADEVRTLASRTQQSTGEIQAIIQSLQGRAAAATQVMKAGRSKAEASVDKAGAAGDSLAKITSAVASINDMNTQIASAAEEQSAVAEEINRNVNTISQVAEETSASAESTSRASEDMARLVQRLQSLVMQFAA